MNTLEFERPITLLDLYDAHEASWRLKRKLTRENPDVLIHTGVTIERPIILRIYLSKEITNKPMKWADYDVQYIEN